MRPMRVPALRGFIILVPLAGILGVAACTQGTTPAAPGAATSPPSAPAAASPAAPKTAPATAASPGPSRAASPRAAASPSPSPAAAAIRVIGLQLQPNDATMTLVNTGSQPVDLSGWTIRLGDATVTLPDDLRIDGNERLTLHTATGTNTEEDVYLGESAADLLTAWEPGSDLILEDASGRQVTQLIIPGR